MVKQPHPPLAIDTDFKPGEYLSFDLSGKITRGYNGEQYRCSLIDRRTGYTFQATFKRRTEYYDFIVERVKLIERQIDGRHVKQLKSDKAGEFIRLEGFCKSHGIKYQHSPPHAHQANSRAERMMRTNMDVLQCNMISAGVPVSFWPFASLFANYTSNLTPTKSLSPRDKQFG